MDESWGTSERYFSEVVSHVAGPPSVGDWVQKTRNVSPVRTTRGWVAETVSGVRRFGADQVRPASVEVTAKIAPPSSV
jgi:hypothetical protein